MKRLFHIIILFTLTLISGCIKDDPMEETSSIYIKEYPIEDMSFKDTTLIYNFNDDQWDDFSFKLTWSFDTTAPNYNVGREFYMYFKYYDNIGCAMSDMKEWKTQTEWQVGDTVINNDSFEGWSVSSGASSFGGSYHSFQDYMSDLRNRDVYWAYYLESGGKIHYGWVRLKCGLFAESAFNLIPEEPILIGQRD
jgi:hypothetical protein